jgi:hypothetical protein
MAEETILGRTYYQLRSHLREKKDEVGLKLLGTMQIQIQILTERFEDVGGKMDETRWEVEESLRIGDVEVRPPQALSDVELTAAEFNPSEVRFHQNSRRQVCNETIGRCSSHS